MTDVIQGIELLPHGLLSCWNSDEIPKAEMYALDTVLLSQGRNAFCPFCIVARHTIQRINVPRKVGQDAMLQANNFVIMLWQSFLTNQPEAERMPWGWGRQVEQALAMARCSSTEKPVHFWAAPSSLTLISFLNGAIPGTGRCGQVTHGRGAAALRTRCRHSAPGALRAKNSSATNTLFYMHRIYFCLRLCISQENIDILQIKVVKSWFWDHATISCIANGHYGLLMDSDSVPPPPRHLS